MRRLTFYSLLVMSMILLSCSHEDSVIEPPVIEEQEPGRPGNPNNPDNQVKPENPNEWITAGGLFKYKINDINMIVGTNDWNGVCRGTNVSSPLTVKYAACGNQGYIAMSDNGTNWTALKLSVANANFYGIAYGQSAFVAVGQSGRIATSTDGGISWSSNTYSPYNDWYRVRYINNMFIALGGSGGYMATSIDGINWSTPTRISSIDDLKLYDIAYTGSDYIVVAGNYITHSANLTDWSTPTKVGTSRQWKTAIARSTYYTGTKLFVACDLTDGYVTTSTDGLNWTNPTIVGYPYPHWADAFQYNGRFIMVGNRPALATSTDGVTWTTYDRLTDESGNEVMEQFNATCILLDL